MVVTSAFHQLRSFLTFRCAVRQSLPPEQRMKVQALLINLPLSLLQAKHIWLAIQPFGDANVQHLS